MFRGYKDQCKWSGLCVSFEAHRRSPLIEQRLAGDSLNKPSSAVCIDRDGGGNVCVSQLVWAAGGVCRWAHQRLAPHTHTQMWGNYASSVQIQQWMWWEFSHSNEAFNEMIKPSIFIFINADLQINTSHTPGSSRTC